MKFFGKFLVIAVFGLAMTAIVSHYLPSIAETAIKLPAYSQDGWHANAGWAISWAMLVFSCMFAGGYKLVKR